jgi:hypothetical protein
MIGWNFPDNGGGAGQGFQDAAKDTFAGQRLQATIRECIQNSLDVLDDKASGPVRVAISLKDIDVSVLPDMEGLKDHLDACVKTAEAQNNADASDYFSKASELIAAGGKAPVLCISDFNTRGLEGPTDPLSSVGGYYALVKGAGLSQKGENALGSYGHGSKASFTMTQLSTIFYFSETINPSGELELRFQGKSILQSHKNLEKEEITQGTGFFGESSTCGPLIDADVPGWAKELRAESDPKCGTGKGTSIIIPFTIFNHDLFPETKITIIANFFTAIDRGNLEIIVNGDEINQHNVRDQFEWAKKNLPSEQDEIDGSHAIECFKAIDTVIAATATGRTVVPNFGAIEWSIRFGDEIEGRSVSIGRYPGMFITNKATKLKRFTGTKPFDLFVFIDAGDGSQTLKKIENPEHSEFQIDRINDPRLKEKIETEYKSLVVALRAIINDLVKTESEGEVSIGELAGLFGDYSGDGDDSNARERGSRLSIASGTSPRAPTDSPGRGRGQGVGGTGGAGKARGTRIVRSKGVGNVEITGGHDTSIIQASAIPAESIRANHSGSGAKNQAIIYFSCFKAGKFAMQFFKAGEWTNEPLAIERDGKSVSCINLNITTPGRMSVTVEFSDKDADKYTIEGWLNEIKE